MLHPIRLYENAMLRALQQRLFCDGLLSETPTAEEIGRALTALHEAREEALEAWEAIPVELREGVLGPPLSE